MLRRIRLPYKAAFVFLLCCPSTYAQNAEGTPWGRVEDPHFGEVIYYFYQQKFFSSLTHVLAARQLNRVSHHAEEAELLQGGLYLSYGLHTEAAGIFQRLIEHGASPQVRDRAWFFIAKIRYQRGYNHAAVAALKKIQHALPPDLEAERKVLLANLLIGQEKYAEAIKLLKTVKGRAEWSAYGQYNVGVALIKYAESSSHLSQSAAEGVQLLSKVGGMPGHSEEMRALRDKANLALGYYFLQQGDAVRSRTYLNEVRIDGPLSNKALLGAGWGYSMEGRHEDSLTPWAELRQRDVMDTAVQESLLAMPYAFSQLGAYRQALQHYQSAIAIYTQELARLDAAIISIREGSLSASILQQGADDEAGWFWRMNRLPGAVESRYLLQLMSSNEFQESFKNYRDLRFLQSNLRAWASDMRVFSDILATRRNAYRQRLPAVRAIQERADIGGLRHRHDYLVTVLDRLETRPDTFELASQRQVQLLNRLARVEHRLLALQDKTDTGTEKDRHRLYSGILRWDIAGESVQKLWETRKSLRESDADIDRLDGQKALLERARITAQRSFEGYDERIQALRWKIDMLLSRLSGQVAKQESHLEQMAVAELLQHKIRLNDHMLQARLGVAQIRDQAAQARSNASQDGRP